MCSHILLMKLPARLSRRSNSIAQLLSRMSSGHNHFFPIQKSNWEDKREERERERSASLGTNPLPLQPVALHQPYTAFPVKQPPGPKQTNQPTEGPRILGASTRDPSPLVSYFKGPQDCRLSVQQPLPPSLPNQFSMPFKGKYVSLK